MSQGIPTGYVLPTPQRAKLVGTLNIVFALLVMLYIAFNLAMFVLTPMIMEMSQKSLGEIQAKAETDRKNRVEEVKKELADAKEEQEKTRLKQQLDAIEKTPSIKMPDFKKIQDMTSTPGYRAWMWCDLLSGLALNVGMFISGIGLLRLRERGRKLGIWIFGLKIARLAILMLITILVIVPMSSKMSADMMREMTKNAGNPAAFPMGDMARFQAIAGTVMAVLGFVLGSVWPIIGLVLLTRPGTAAACRVSPSKPAALEPDLL